MGWSNRIAVDRGGAARAARVDDPAGHEAGSEAGGAWRGVVLGVQALVVNLAFAFYAKPALSNVACSTRGVMAVIFVRAITIRGKDFLSGRQLLGAALMVVVLIQPTGLLPRSL